MRARVLRFVALLVGGATLAGCVDIRDFEGSWAGDVVSEPAVRQSFAARTRVDPLVLTNVDLEGLTATLSTTDGKFNKTSLLRVVKISNDPLASLTFDGDPLRSYFLFAPLKSEPDGWPAWLVLSLFSDDHVELRIVRGNDLFGVFSLIRKE